MPSIGQWRDASAYDYIQDLDPAAIAWEFLRRNPAYQQDYKAVMQHDQDNKPAIKALAARWGLRCCPINPEIPTQRGCIHWSPQLDPVTIPLVPSPFPDKNPLISRDTHQDILSNPAPEPERLVFSLMVLADTQAPSPLAALVLLDDDTLDRLDAVTRFWLTLQKRKVTQDHRMTPQRRQRLRQTLRVVDARGEGMTYRAIGETLFPRHRIDPASWVGNPIRETIIRLARDGAELVHGGHWKLLRHPRRRPRSEIAPNGQ